MLIARNPLDNTYISAFDVKHMPPQAQPSKLLCPGLSPDGSPCSAAVTPAALDSDHKHPYFRVGRVTDHIADCTESSTRVNPPDHTTDRRGIKGKEAPRGPERRVQIELRHPEASAARAANNAPRTLKSHTGHHRAPAPRDHTRPMTLQCGIRKAALDYARGIISDTDTVSLGGKRVQHANSSTRLSGCSTHLITAMRSLLSGSCTASVKGQLQTLISFDYVDQTAAPQKSQS